jgi:hypothetical protein
VKIEGIVITTQNEVQRLYQSLKKQYTIDELEKIVKTIYENRHNKSDFVLEVLQNEYSNADMDTIDFVMIWLRQIFTQNCKELV